MNIFGLEITKRSSVQHLNTKEGWLAKLLNFDNTPVPVTANKVLGLSAYWRCVNLITSSIAGLPIKALSYDSSVNSVDLPAIRAIRNPNPNIISFTYNEMIIGSALMYGNGYAYIDRVKNKIELIPLPNDCVEPFMYDGEIFYHIKIGSVKEIVSKENIIHLRGFGLDPIVGHSVMDAHRTTLGIGLATQRESLNFYAKGTKIDGYIKMPGKLDDTIKNTVRENWSKNYGQNGTGGGTAILDNAMEYVRLGMPPADAQFIENGNYSDEQIATIFGVPLPLINKLERATHSNIEQLSIDFVTYCLMPWVRKLEQEYYSKLLTYSEQGKYYFKYNVNALMRADSQGRAEFYRIMVNAGIMTRGEVRKLEDLDPMEGDSELYVPLNMIPIGKSDAYYDSVIEGKTKVTSKNTSEQ